MSSKKGKLNKINISEIAIGSMLMIVVGIMPLVVRFGLRRIPPELFHWNESYIEFWGGPFAHDFLAHWKGIFLIVPACIIAFICVSDWVTRDWVTKGDFPDFISRFKRPPMIFSLVYLLFVIISAIASNYSQTSWFGTLTRSEGVFIWLAYFTVFFAAMSYVREPKYAKFILYGLIFSSIVMGAIGVSQVMGRSFFGTRFANFLILGGVDRIEGIGERFDMANGTLFNPNTFGKYTAMLSPIMLLAALTYNGKRYVNALFLVAGVLMLLGVFGSSSLGGLVGIVTAAGVLAGTYVCGLIYRAKHGAAINFFGISAKWLVIAAIGAVGAVALAIFFVPTLNNRVSVLFNRMGVAMRAETVTGMNYIFEDDTLTIYSGYTRAATITINGLDIEDWITVRDGSGQIVPHATRTQEPPTLAQTPDGEMIQIPQPSHYTFNVPGYRTIAFDKSPDSFTFHAGRIVPMVLTFDNGRIYGAMPPFRLIDIIDLSVTVPAWGFEGRETWGSNRGYIWSRTFPMMPSRVIIGSGPDTFMNVFPQHEIVAKQRFFYEPYHIVTMAHNLFLQTWINTGGISAIALFALFGHYLFTTFLSLVKSKGEELFSYGLRLGLLTGISAFVMSSNATDSTIGSTGVFFVLLGVGYGMNAWAKNADFSSDKEVPTQRPI